MRRSREASRREMRLGTSSWSLGVLPPSVVAGACLAVSRWEFEAPAALAQRTPLRPSEGIHGTLVPWARLANAPGPESGADPMRATRGY